MTGEDATEEAKLNNELDPISFLYASYNIWWWEILEVIRKFVLSGFIVFVNPGSPEQSILLMVLTLFSTMLYQYFTPFRGEENRLAMIASYTLFFVAFASLLIKFEPGFLQSSVFDIVFVIIVASPLVLAFLYSRAFVDAVRQVLGLSKSETTVNHSRVGQRVVPAEAFANVQKKFATLTKENEQVKEAIKKMKAENARLKKEALPSI